MWIRIESSEDEHGFVVSETWELIDNEYYGIIFNKIGYRANWSVSQEDPDKSTQLPLAKGDIDTEEIGKTAEEKMKIAIFSCKSIVEFHIKLLRKDGLFSENI